MCIAQAYLKQMKLYQCNGINELRLSIGQREQIVPLLQGQWKGQSWKNTMQYYSNKLDLLNEHIDVLLNIYQTNCEAIFEMGFDLDIIMNIWRRYTPINGNSIKDIFDIIEAICKGQFEAVYAYPPPVS